MCVTRTLIAPMVTILLEVSNLGPFHEELILIYGEGVCFCGLAQIYTPRKSGKTQVLKELQAWC